MKTENTHFLLYALLLDGFMESLSQTANGLLYSHVSYPEERVNLQTHNAPYLALIAGDASDRKFYRLINDNSSAICMRFPKWEGGYGGDPLSWLGMHHALKAVGIPVPEILAIEEKRCCIWTEDFGDDFLNCKLKTPLFDMFDERCTETLNLYKSALDLLVKAQYPNCPIPHHPAQKLAFDSEKLMFEMRFFVTHFLSGLLNYKFNETDPKWQPLFKDFTNLCEFLGAQERVLCHRDYHVRNVMVYNNQTKWIDFQDARMGPHTYDAVSLIRDSYVKIAQETREYLFNYYYNATNEARQAHKLAPIPQEQYVVESCYMGLQRNLKAIGSFGYLATVKNKPNYLQYVVPTLETILQPAYADSSVCSMRQKFPALFDLITILYKDTHQSLRDYSME